MHTCVDRLSTFIYPNIREQEKQKTPFFPNTSKVIVITGANRGIGLALAKAFSDQGHKVIATARKPEDAKQLRALPNVIGIVKAEMADLPSLPRVAEEIAELAPDGIDELWNNAGQNVNNGPPAEIDPLSFHKELGVNVAAPTAMTKHLLPLLRKRQTRKVIFMSSAMGSKTYAAGFIGASLKGLNPTVQEDFFIQVSYSTSKAALTMSAIGWNGTLFKEGFTTIALHPGWVQTDMTGGPGRATLTTDQSVLGMLSTVGAAKPSKDLVLLNYDGKTLPW